MPRTIDLRACADWPSGEGAVVNAAAFLEREDLPAPARQAALEALRAGRTYTDDQHRWSLTPLTSIPDRKD